MTRTCPLCKKTPFADDKMEPHEGVVVCLGCWEEYKGNEVSLRKAIKMKEKSKMKAKKKETNYEEELDTTQPQSINKHEGKKYLREIQSAEDDDNHQVLKVDVYCVLDAFGVSCPGRQQAIKKLLCAGQRGKGSVLEDLIGALAALNRAIELERKRGRKR